MVRNSSKRQHRGSSKTATGVWRAHAAERVRRWGRRPAVRKSSQNRRSTVIHVEVNVAQIIRSLGWVLTSLLLLNFYHGHLPRGPVHAPPAIVASAASVKV